MKSVVGMSNISAMMSTISVRTSTSTSTSPLPAGSSGELEHLESSAGTIHCAWSRHTLSTAAHGHGPFSTSAKTPRRRVARCCEELCFGINYPLRRSVLFPFQTCNHRSDTGWTRNYHLPCINPIILTFYPWKVREWDYRNFCKTFYRWTFAPVKVTNGFIPAVRVCPVLCSVLFMIMTLHIRIPLQPPSPRLVFQSWEW